MTTTDHILAACGRLRVSWGWLAATVAPGRVRRNQRMLSPKAIEERNRRAILERADKAALTREGTLVGGGRSPINLGAVETRARIATDVDHLAAELSLAVATVRKVGAHYTNSSTADAKFGTALNWISRNALHIRDPHLINDAHNRLTAADRSVRALTGEGSDRRRLAAECPACGRRSLAWDTSSDRHEEWHVLCTSGTCRCQGRDCGCKQPDREHGATHVWLESTWSTLAVQLDRKEQA